MSPKHVLIELAPPDKVSILKTAGKTEITFAWFNANHGLSAVLCAIPGFFAFLYRSELSTERWFTALIMLGLHLICTSIFLYHALTGFFNRTTVTVENGSLAVTYGPLPWRRERSRSPDSVDSVYVKIDETAHIMRQNYPPVFYAVYALKAHKAIPIIRYIESELVAAYLCTAIQAALGQVTRPYWQTLLYQLEYHGADSPGFKAEKFLPYPPTLVGAVVQPLLCQQYRNRVGLVTNDTQTQFDALHFDYNGAKIYHLTRIVITAALSGSNVIAIQKIFPYVGLKWAHQRAVDGFLRDIEAQLEQNQLSDVR